MKYYLTCTIGETGVLVKYVATLMRNGFKIKPTSNKDCYTIIVNSPADMFTITELINQEIIITTINPLNSCPTIEIYDWKRE